jgi:hypothetical protein
MRSAQPSTWPAASATTTAAPLTDPAIGSCTPLSFLEHSIKGMDGSLEPGKLVRYDFPDNGIR